MLYSRIGNNLARFLVRIIMFLLNDAQLFEGRSVVNPVLFEEGKESSKSYNGLKVNN